MNLSLLATYSLAVLLLIITPGPVVALLISTATREGQRKAFMTLLGTNGASLLLMTIAVLTLAGVVHLSPVYLYLLGIAGSFYIGFGAISELLTIRKLPNVNIDNESTSTLNETTKNSGLVRGFIIGVVNPKDILFFVAFFPQFIAVTHNFSTSVITLSSIWVLFDASILSLYILCAKWWSKAFNSRWIEGLCEGFLLAVAVGGVFYNSQQLLLLSVPS
ncbi:TPA: LysE family translocator [Vibrio parahaemolyticus]|uniref:LysE family translocator n=1 Tax=Vibrio TaxID=662 RepID=UPI00146C2C2B|nr:MULTISPECIES: LysE family translocator [Vibrio]EJE4167981.1 LysE family translocator [Vibrio parahaemolyticus]EJG1636782.1 LysE family translocator [Vibrio alginolyticus]EJL6855975.1 LysE family translocator [Vibrio alginolyticus]ELB2765642.1 LysE family translocator [Vibrio alginolyticus]MBS9880829.1 LysE family translocator [Vibrio alginolyticus]